MFSEPSVKQEVLKRAMQMIEKNPNALNTIVQHLLENKDAISAKINAQKKSIRSLKGEKAYWTGQLNKLAMTSEIGTKIKQIGRNIRALERQIRDVEKTPFDLDNKLVDGTTISSFEVRHTPATNDEEEFDAGGTEPVESPTPINEYLASLGKEPQPWPSTDESDGNLLDSRFGANEEEEEEGPWNKSLEQPNAQDPKARVEAGVNPLSLEYTGPERAYRESAVSKTGIEFLARWKSSDYEIYFPQIPYPPTEEQRKQEIYDQVIPISRNPEQAKRVFDFVKKLSEKEKDVTKIFVETQKFVNKLDDEEDTGFSEPTDLEKTKPGKPALSTSRVESVPDPIHVIGESSIGDQVVADAYKATPLDKKNPSALTEDERYALFTEYRSSLSPAEFNKLHARGEDGFDEWLKNRQNGTEAKGAITPVAKKSYEAPLIQTGELEGTEKQHAPERLSTFNRRADVAGVHLETMQRENGSYTLIIDDQSVSLGKDIAIAEKLFNLAMVGVGKAKNKTDFSPLINEIRAARDGQLDARKKNSVPTEDLDDRFWQERSAGKKAAEEAGREWTAEEADKLAREAQARVQESRAAGISKDDHNNAYWQSQRSASARGRYPNGPEKQTTPETKPAGLFAKGPEVLQDDLWDEIEEQPIEKVSKGPDAQKTAATRETFQPLPDAWDKVLKEMEESNPRTETPTVVDRVIVNPDRFPTQQLETIKPDNATETPSDNEWWNKSGVEQLSGAWASLDKSMGDGASEASLITMGVPKSILKKYPTPEALHKFLENPGIWARINGDASETRKALNHFVEAQNNKRIINSPAETLASRSQRDAIDRPRTPKQQLPR
ncbi:hypothetical protein A2318_04605 [Candidatus Uhrbacteria bacterium RIFOXYB2_FULL_45_11]|uniref:Uncharacterized protein n=1 Tax=Candidatus Uhrbacteria bacterium RIFOXYB2_FULL_45_11 TaxID=1802421 RepID=A0A1F7W752_9BACT|nr:MAG: hypothetical protein A2318_04605 [Candidatus Uhrbacteria bacterium RIFOXYB2_FULL_45_11]